MKKLFFLTSLLLFSFLSFSPFIHAEKMTPKILPEVIHFQQRYSVDVNKYNDGKRNYITAWDMQRNMRLWTLKIYDQPSVAISSLSIQDGQLLVENEAREKYLVNLKTQEIQKIK